MSSVEAGPKQCGSCEDFRTVGVDGKPFGTINVAGGSDSSSVKKLKMGVCGRPFGLLFGVRTEDATCNAELPFSSSKHPPITTEI